MKKFLISLIALTSLVFYSCGSNGSSETTEVSDSTAVETADSTEVIVADSTTEKKDSAQTEK